MKLTKAEKKLIEELREKQRIEDEKNTPKFEGTLKHNLYVAEKGTFEISNWLLSEDELNEEIQSFRESFEIKIPAGSKFVCFVDNCDQSWYDDVCAGIENMSEEWAKDNLENIKPYKDE